MSFCDFSSIDFVTSVIISCAKSYCGKLFLMRKFMLIKSVNKLLVILGLGFWLHGLATNANANSTFTVRSLGLQKCEQLVGVMQGEAESQAVVLYSQWMAGYLTAKNASLGVLDVFPIRDPLGEWVRFVTLVCASNMNKTLAEVLEGSVSALADYRETGASAETLELADGEYKIRVYKNYLIRMQQHLNGRGFKVDSIGRFDESTKRAFLEYKKSNNIVGPALPDSLFLVFVLSQGKTQ